jgi:hypothetical protein
VPFSFCAKRLPTTTFATQRRALKGPATLKNDQLIIILDINHCLLQINKIDRRRREFRNEKISSDIMYHDHDFEFRHFKDQDALTKTMKNCDNHEEQFKIRFIMFLSVSET